jgi:opacity protein-like surface antigen
MLRFKIFVCIGFLLTVISVTAQDECELVLNRATDEFNAGHLYVVPSLLIECLQKNQNKEWRQRAFLLLSETYLLLEEPLKAENSYLEVLRANPEFVTDEKRDPIDLVYLSSKFTTNPIFTLFVKGGSNVSFVRTILDRQATSGRQRNLIRPGFQVGVGADWNYNDQLSLMLECNYVFSSYKQHTSGIYGRDVADVYDRQSWVRLPLSVKYSDDKGKYRPYVYLGASIDFLLGDRVTITYSDRNNNPDANREENIDRESPVLKFKPKRNMINRSWLIGGGVKYKVNLDYVFVDLRYSFGLTNLVDSRNSIYDYDEMDSRTSEGFQNSAEAAMRWGYVDDFFRMDHLFLSVGYIHPLYKPRKLKKARSKSVMRTIKKQDHAVPEK